VSLRDLALTPRAVALLVILREGPLSASAIQYALRDRSIYDTRGLLRDANAVPGVVMCYDGTLWGLTHDGLGWLQLQGLDASEGAKQALYTASDARTGRREQLQVIGGGS
jgi:hypothetical protein